MIRREDIVFYFGAKTQNLKKSMEEITENYEKLEKENKNFAKRTNKMRDSIKGVIDKFKILGLIGVGTMAALFMNTARISGPLKYVIAQFMLLFNTMAGDETSNGIINFGNFVGKVTEFLNKHPTLKKVVNRFTALVVTLALFGVIYGAAASGFAAIATGIGLIAAAFNFLSIGVFPIIAGFALLTIAVAGLLYYMKKRGIIDDFADSLGRKGLLAALKDTALLTGFNLLKDMILRITKLLDVLITTAIVAWRIVSNPKGTLNIIKKLGIGGGVSAIFKDTINKIGRAAFKETGIEGELFYTAFAMKYANITEEKLRDWGDMAERAMDDTEVLGEATQILTKSQNDLSLEMFDVTSVFGDLDQATGDLATQMEETKIKIEEIQSSFESITPTIFPTPSPTPSWGGGGISTGPAAGIKFYNLPWVGSGPSSTNILAHKSYALGAGLKMWGTSYPIAGPVTLTQSQIESLYIHPQSFQEGGLVERTGLALVHSGEYVIPQGESRGINIFITGNSIREDSDIDELVEKISIRLRTEMINRNW
ncbi:MAG: hypothetical protein ACTSPB_02025 [Candidatus Thorarchaeota archaeon]